MLSRFAMLAFAGILAFSPVVHVSMTNERGVLLLHARVDGIGPMIFIFDPGAGDFITTYARDRLGGKPADEITLGEATFRGPFPVLSGDPEQLDPRHDPGSGGIAGSIGPAILRHYAVRIDYADAAISLIPFVMVAPASGAESLPLQFDGFGLPTVAAAVDGYSGRFEIDVRAPVSMLFTPFVREHTLRERQDHNVSIGRYTVSDSTLRLSRASGGKFASRDVAGLIGNDVLSGFTVTLDYQRNVVYFER